MTTTVNPSSSQSPIKRQAGDDVVNWKGRGVTQLNWYESNETLRSIGEMLFTGTIVSAALTIGTAIYLRATPVVALYASGSLILATITIYAIGLLCQNQPCWNDGSYLERHGREAELAIQAHIRLGTATVHDILAQYEKLTQHQLLTTDDLNRIFRNVICDSKTGYSTLKTMLGSDDPFSFDMDFDEQNTKALTAKLLQFLREGGEVSQKELDTFSIRELSLQALREKKIDYPTFALQTAKFLDKYTREAKKEIKGPALAFYASTQEDIATIMKRQDVMTVGITEQELMNIAYEKLIDDDATIIEYANFIGKVNGCLVHFTSEEKDSIKQRAIPYFVLSSTEDIATIMKRQDTSTLSISAEELSVYILNMFRERSITYSIFVQKLGNHMAHYDEDEKAEITDIAIPYYHGTNESIPLIMTRVDVICLGITEQELANYELLLWCTNETGAANLALKLGSAICLVRTKIVAHIMSMAQKKGVVEIMERDDVKIFGITVKEFVDAGILKEELELRRIPYTNFREKHSVDAIKCLSKEERAPLKKAYTSRYENLYNFPLDADLYGITFTNDTLRERYKIAVETFETEKKKIEEEHQRKVQVIEEKYQTDRKTNCQSIEKFLKTNEEKLQKVEETIQKHDAEIAELNRIEKQVPILKGERDTIIDWLYNPKNGASFAVHRVANSYTPMTKGEEESVRAELERLEEAVQKKKEVEAALKKHEQADHLIPLYEKRIEEKTNVKRNLLLELEAVDQVVSVENLIVQAKIENEIVTVSQEASHATRLRDKCQADKDLDGDTSRQIIEDLMDVEQQLANVRARLFPQDYTKILDEEIKKGKERCDAISKELIVVLDKCSLTRKFEIQDKISKLKDDKRELVNAIEKNKTALAKMQKLLDSQKEMSLELLENPYKEKVEKIETTYKIEMKDIEWAFRDAMEEIEKKS